MANMSLEKIKMPEQAPDAVSYTHLYHVQTIVQILTECFILYHFFQICLLYTSRCV